MKLKKITPPAGKARIHVAWVWRSKTLWISDGSKGQTCWPGQWMRKRSSCSIWSLFKDARTAALAFSNPWSRGAETWDSVRHNLWHGNCLTQLACEENISSWNFPINEGTSYLFFISVNSSCIWGWARNLRKKSWLPMRRYPAWNAAITADPASSLRIRYVPTEKLAWLWWNNVQKLASWLHLLVGLLWKCPLIIYSNY